jgi:S1-C subfamily serine protease
MKKKKNKNFRVSRTLWFGVVIAIVAAVALATNVVGIRGARNLRSPVANSVTAPHAGQAVPMPPINTAEVAGLPNTALSIQEGINHAVSMVRSTVVSISGPLSLGKVGAQSGLTYIHPYAGSTESSIGSGVIVNSRGYILTTFQTVGKAREVEVTVFSAGRQKYLADVIATDPQTDLVLLKIRSFDSFPTAILGNSDSLEVGDIVFAVGSPFGFSKTVTMGIVSTNRRQLNINGVRYPDMIQTDAAINDGDDGGPLINIKGEVIGINMAYFVPGNHFTGIGFALPINDAKPLLNAVQ